MDSLRLYLPELVQFVDFNNLSPFLLSEGLLTFPDLERLKKCGSREEQISLLVSILQTKGKSMYQLFRRALERSTNEECSHLGHVDLLEILPKISKGDSIDLLTSSLSDVNLDTIKLSPRRQPVLLPTSKPLEEDELANLSTDSGILDSALDLSVEVDSPRSNGNPKGDHCQTLSQALSVAISGFQQVQIQMTQLKDMNGLLVRENEELKHILTQIKHCTQMCVPEIMKPLIQVPQASVIRNFLARSSRLGSKQFSMSILMVVAGNALTYGETLNSCSQILSGILGIPIKLNSLMMFQPIHLKFPNNDVIQITIIDTFNGLHFSQNPDLVIGIYTEFRSLQSQEVLSWSRHHQLSRLTVQLALDHECIHKCCDNVESTPVIHVLPLHQHLVLCLSYRLTHLFMECVERAKPIAQEMLLELNRQRIKSGDLVHNSIVSSEQVDIHKLFLYCT